MNAPQDQHGVTAVQAKTAPLEVNDDVVRVGYKVDRENVEDVLGRKAGHVVAPEDRLPIVTEWSGMDDWVNCPPDYATFFKQYDGYVRHLCFKYGVLAKDVEDMKQDLLTRFMERDSLGVFTPSWGSLSKTRKSNFRSYLSRFVLTYVTGYKRNYAKYSSRHLAIMDAPIDDDGTTWADAKLPAHTDNLGGVEFAEIIASVRERVPGDVLDAVLTLAQDGAVRLGDLRSQLGCDAATARSGLARVRRALETAQAR